MLGRDNVGWWHVLPLRTVPPRQGQSVAVKLFQQELEDVFKLDPGIVIKEGMIYKKRNHQ